MWEKSKKSIQAGGSLPPAPPQAASAVHPSSLTPTPIVEIHFFPWLDPPRGCAGGSHFIFSGGSHFDSPCKGP